MSALGKEFKTALGENLPHKRSRSIGRWIADGFGRTRVRIAVVGAKQAGKTVLLTALQNHLRWLTTACVDDKDREAKTLVGGWYVDKVERITPQDWEEFPYASNREKLSKNGCWPEETKKFRCMELDVDLKNGKRKRLVRLQVLDIPGERFTDLGSMSHANYEKWCKRVRDWHYEPGTPGASQWKDYEAEIGKVMDDFKDYAYKGNGEDARQRDREAIISRLVGRYRAFVEFQTEAFSPLVTPSEFILQNYEGKEDGARQDRIGLSRLVPVTQEMMESKNALLKSVVRELKKRYEKYKTELKVERVVEWLETVNQVYYLVDVMETLRKGRQAYYGLGYQIRTVMEVFNPRVGRVKGLWDFAFKTKPQKFRAVATQIDRVLGESRDRANLKKLLKSLFARSADGMDDVDYMLCAAVRSTAEGGTSLTGNFKRDRLKGREDYVKDEEGNEQKNYGGCTYSPNAVPDIWDWPDGRCRQYREWLYPEPTRFSADIHKVPEAIGLKELVSEMILP